MTLNYPARITALAALLAGLVGCSGSDGRFKVYPVEGQVTVGGEPADGAKVFFHPKDRLADPAALRPFATADAAGRFRATTYFVADGAPTGEYVVTITWPPAGGKDDTPAGDRLRGAYADARTSPLRATVKPVSNTLETFRLK